MTTVAQIALAAFDGVAAAITDAVHAATLARDARGAYNTTTGAHAITTTTQTGRAVFANETPIGDVFPDYEIGPDDQLFVLQGFTAAREADRLTVGGVTRTVMRAQDIAGAGSVFYVVAR